MGEPGRIEFHCHTILSDGALLPSELLRRAAVSGHEAVAITDHADASNLAFLIESLQRLLAEQPDDFGLHLLIGVELTHVGPGSIDRLARRAKALGAEVVVVHGETLVEPVAQGTNRAAVESSAVDILAHPGLLSPDETRIAAERECYVELTTRKGHSLANGHVARVCLESGAPLIVNSDAHEPSDLPTLSFAQRVAEGAGLSPQQVSEATLTNPRRLLARVLDSRKTWV